MNPNAGFFGGGRYERQESSEICYPFSLTVCLLVPLGGFINATIELRLAVERFGVAGIVSYAQNQRTAWWGENENLVRW